MNIHENARTTPAGRELLVRRIEVLGWSPTEAGRAAGVSRQTVHKWVRRKREGDGALRDRSSRALRRPHAMPGEWADVIAFLRQFKAPARAIAAQLGLPRSTVSGVLARRGLGSRRALEPVQPICRYERRQPGDLLHLDTKKLGRFWQPGHRATSERRQNSRGAGWEFVHVAVDDHSRLAYAEVLADESPSSCVAFLLRARTWFGQQGITIKRVLTDNGNGYVSHRFRQACLTYALRHLRTRPRTPQTNGKAERFIQTMLREWAYVRFYDSSMARARHLAPWLRHYNQQRPHASLGYLPPFSRIPSIRQ
jgi:transposase InsO family protein